MTVFFFWGGGGGGQKIKEFSDHCRGKVNKTLFILHLEKEASLYYRRKVNIFQAVTGCLVHSTDQLIFESCNKDHARVIQYIIEYHLYKK